MVDIEFGRVGDGLVVVVGAPAATCQLAVLALARLLDRFGEEDFLAGVAAVVVGIDPQLEPLPLIPPPEIPGPPSAGRPPSPATAPCHPCRRGGARRSRPFHVPVGGARCARRERQQCGVQAKTAEDGARCMGLPFGQGNTDLKELPSHRGRPTLRNALGSDGKLNPGARRTPAWLFPCRPGWCEGVRRAGHPRTPCRGL